MPPSIGETGPDASDEGYQASDEDGFLATKPLVERVGQPAGDGCATPIHAVNQRREGLTTPERTNMGQNSQVQLSIRLVLINYTT